MRGLTWSVLKWGAALVGAGTAVGLGVDVAVAGRQSAEGVAGVVSAVCEVVAVVLAIVGWVNEKRSTTVARPAPGSVPPDPDVMARPEGPGGGCGKYVVDVRDARNVQIGDGNTMNTGGE